MVGGAACCCHMALCISDADRTLPAAQIFGSPPQNGPSSGALAEGGREARPRTLQRVSYCQVLYGGGSIYFCDCYIPHNHVMQIKLCVVYNA